jgi:hypothetical protein
MTAKTYREFTASIIDTLEALGLTYAIGGSFASNAYGEARMTVDIDISIVLPIEEVKHLVDAVRALGYFLIYDAIIDALVHDLPVNIIDGESGYKVDLFLVKPTPLEQSILARRQPVIYDPATKAAAMLYSPEDVIVYKLKYYLQGRSQKHLRDIGAMLIVQGDALDYDYIAHWAQELGALDVWQQLLDEYHRRLSG